MDEKGVIIPVQNTELQKAFKSFADNVKAKALLIVSERMPLKIFELNNALTSDLFSYKTEHNLVNGDKKLKIDFQDELALEKIESLLKYLKQEILEMIEMCNSVKLWIQLNIPRIEDGNNFGVSIQEEVVTELAKGEESGFLLLETVTKYYHLRAKLTTKIEKHPNNVDYKKSLMELDEKQWKHFIICGTDLRNNYAIIYDIVQKNFEKLVKPRSSNSNTMY